MSDVVKFPQPPEGPFTPQIHGPFLPDYFVTIDGYRVPYLTVRPMDDGRINLIVDHRFMLNGPVSKEEFNRWLPILANAMAVAAGYSSHGEHCRPLKDLVFMTKMSSLGGD